MAKSYNVSFNILGNLDSSLLSSLQNAANAMRGLGNLAQSVNAQAVKHAQNLADNNAALKNIDAYRALQRAIAETQRQRAQELLNASRLEGSYKNACKEVDRLQRSLDELRDKRKAANKDLSQERGALAYLRQQRTALKEQMKALGGTRSRKIPRELLGTAQGRQLADVLKQLDANKKAIEEHRIAFRSARDGALQLRSQMRSVGKELKSAQATASELAPGFTKATQNAQRLSEQLAKQRADLAQLRQNLNNAGMSGTLAAHEMRLRAAIQSTTNALNQEIAALQRRNELQNNFNMASQNLSNAYSNFQNSLQTAETIMNPFKDAAQNAMTFEAAMSKVKALTQMRNIRSGSLERVNREMASLREQAERLGATTEFTRGEVANAMSFYGMAGWDYRRIQAAMDQTVDLATIDGRHNIPRMADIISDTATAMGIKAGDTITLANGKIVDAMTHYGDSWAYAVTQANLNSEDLFTAMKYNAPAMHIAGLTQGEIFASNMVAANAGLKGSIAGTAFRTGIIRIQAPAKAGAKALQEMGINASDAQKEMAAAGAAMQQYGVTATGVMGKLVQIKQAFDKLNGDKEAQASLINDVFGKNAYSTWAHVLSGANLDTLRQIAAEIDTGAVEGWAKETAAVMRDNTKTALELLYSSLDAAQGQIGEALTPTIRIAAESFVPMVTNLAEWIKQNQTAVQWAAILAAAVSTVTVSMAGLALASAAFGYIVSGIQMAVGAVRFLAGAFRVAAAASAIWGVVTAAAGFIASAPVWLIVGAVLAVIAAIGYATGAFDGLGAAISAAWNDPRGAVTGFTELMKSAVDNAVQYVLDRWNTLKNALAHPLEATFNLIDHGSVVGGNVKSGEQMRAIAAAHAANAQSGGLGAIQERITQIDAGKLTIDTSNIKPIPVEVDTSALKNTAIQTALQQQNLLPTYLQGAMPQSAPAQQIPATEPIDTTATQAALDGVGQSAQSAATGIASINQAGTNLQSLSTNSQTAGLNVQAVGNASQTTAPQVDSLGTSSGMAFGNVDLLGGSAGAASGQVDAMSSAAGAVAEALRGKAAEIGAIHISVPTVSVGGGQPAMQNYMGGIYRKGAFVTTFAERSAEAAIPLDGSRRAQDLWTRAGQILGLLPSTQAVTYDIPRNGGETKYRGREVALRRGSRPAERTRRETFAIPYDTSRNIPQLPKIFTQTQSTTYDIEKIFTQAKETIIRELPGQIISARASGGASVGLIDKIIGALSSSQTNLSFLPKIFTRTQPTTYNSQAQSEIYNTSTKSVSLPKIFTQTQPTIYDRPRNFDDTGYRGQNVVLPQVSRARHETFAKLYDTARNVPQLPKILTQTQPAMELSMPLSGDAPNQLILAQDTAGLVDRSATTSATTLNVTINVNISGNADEQTVQRGVESALPALDDWLARHKDFQHEERRRSYA